MLHDWRGNVRELENVTQRALLFCGGNTIEASHIVFDRPVTTTFQRTAQVRKVAVLIHTLRMPTAPSAQIVNAANITPQTRTVRKTGRSMN